MCICVSNFKLFFFADISLYLVFQEMKIAGVQPDTAVYNTLINACAGIGNKVVLPYFLY